MTGHLTCAEVDEVAVDLALGTLTGAERAAAVAHLESCPRCRATVDRLRRTADSILVLAPEEQPPVGFESRVAAGMAATAGRRRGSPLRRRLAVAASVAAVALGGGLAGRLIAPPGTSSPSSGVRVALASADGGRAVCRAVVVPGSPVRLVVTIDERGGGAGDYVVESSMAGGNRTETLGTLEVVGGHGVLTSALATGAGDVRAVRVFEGGRLRYEARFE